MKYYTQIGNVFYENKTNEVTKLPYILIEGVLLGTLLVGSYFILFA